MKNQNNLPVTEVMSPPQKIKVANHPTHGLFSLCLDFVPSACPEPPFFCVFLPSSFSRLVSGREIT